MNEIINMQMTFGRKQAANTGSRLSCVCWKERKKEGKKEKGRKKEERKTFVCCKP